MRSRRGLAALALAATLVAALGGMPAASAGDTQTLQVGGETREYYLHVPAKLADQPGAPLVLVLHGAGSRGRQAVRRYGWETKADNEGFIVAGPDAWRRNPDQPADFRSNPRFWNDAVRRGAPGLLKIDDVAFITALIDRIAEQHKIDRKRVYVAGFSSGAGMSQRLAAELADRIAAVAPVAGVVAPTQDTPSRAVPFFYISGDADPLNPVQGGDIDLTLWGARYQKSSQASILDRWRQLDGCKSDERREAPSDAVQIRIWGPCRDASEVRYALIRNHGHHWPGESGAGLPEGLVGPRSQSFDATAAIWQFFARFRLP